MADSLTAVVGRVRRAHGIKGELVIALETDAPDAIFAPGARVLARRRQSEGPTETDQRGPAGSPALHELVVRSAREFKDGLLVYFTEISDRTAAERWRGATLLVPVNELEPPDEGELWAHELAGMRAVNRAGELLGEVRGYYELPQGLVLELLTARGLRDVPFNDAFVVSFDRQARVMTLDVPEGLLE